MYEQRNNSTENKNLSAASSVAQKSKSNTVKRGLNLVDNRPEIISQRKLITPNYAQNNTENTKVTQKARAPQKPKKAKTNYWVEKRKKERLYAAKPYRRYDDKLNEIKTSADHLKLNIKLRKKQVEDDDDVKWLDKQITKLEKIKIEARHTRQQIRSAPKGRFRSQTVVRDGLIEQLNGYPIAIYRINETVNKYFPLHGGGFGAKGRAHAMDVAINPQAPPLGKHLNNTFISDVNLQGSNLGLTHGVYKSAATVTSERAGAAIIMGIGTSNYSNKSQTLSELSGKLSPINTPQNVSFNNTPAGRARGTGQYANMGNTNATGYAWLTNIPGYNTQRWEWLHLRGAGLGGYTNSTNLVAGVRDANTHMIPFESNVRLLATAVATNPNYSCLKVTWSVSGRIANHAFNTINMSWNLIPSNSSTQKIGGQVGFKPLNTGSNISKTEVDLIEGALKNVRDNVITK